MSLSLMPFVLRRGLVAARPQFKLIPSRNIAKHSYCDAHMNELPVPCGSFYVNYNDRNAFYNKVLIGGVAWFLLSFIIMVNSGAMWLNWGPPLQPGPPSDLIDECIEEE